MKPRGRVWRNGVFPSHIGLPDSEHTGQPRWHWCCTYCLEWNLTHWGEWAEMGGCAKSASDGNDHLRDHTEAHHDGAHPKSVYKVTKGHYEGFRR